MNGQVFARFLQYTPGTPADYPVVPTNGQQALDSIAELINYLNPQMIYVDAVNGDDATGTGAELRPYQTLQVAMAAVAAAPAGNYALKLAPGDYGGAPVAIPSQLNKTVSIIGSGRTSNISALLSYTSTGPASDEGVLLDSVGVSNPFDIDLGAAISPAFVILNNGGYNPNRIDTLAPGPQFVKVTNSFIGYVQANSDIQMVNCNFTGGPASVIGATGNVIMMNTIFSFMNATVDGNLALIGCLTDGTVLTGTGTLSGDASSLQNITSSLPGKTYFDEATQLGFTPTTPADFPVGTDTVQEALDYLGGAAVVSGAKTNFVFQPGGVTSGNTYATWSDLVAALAANAGPKTIFFDDSISSPCVIPAGVYGLEECSFDNAKKGEVTQVQVAAGVSWTGLVGISNLQVEFLNTAVVESLNQRAMFFDGAEITANGTAPIWDCPTGAQFQCVKGTILNGSAGARVLEISAGQSFQLVANQFTNANSDAIGGVVGTTLSVFHADESSGIVLPQTNMLGALNVTLLTNAEKLAYSPATPANWSSVPAQVAEALDTLAADVSAITPGLPWEKEVIALTAPQIAGGVTLAQTPVSDSFNIKIEGGGEVILGTDYFLVADLLTFSAGLQALLAVGQQIEVNYQY